uniref:Uncharacterized protein n=1 Tax=Picea sitchensis TaxID=3332 RepID=A0A6B9XS05_PICSI|nr:hypothetical protein Q903MT_gene5493 [Picea sitchensis]
MFLIPCYAERRCSNRRSLSKIGLSPVYVESYLANPDLFHGRSAASDHLFILSWPIYPSSIFVGARPFSFLKPYKLLPYSRGFIISRGNEMRQKHIHL